MSKLALYNTSSGAITAFYDRVDNPPPSTLPAGTATLAISDADWHMCLSTPGYTVSAGALVPPSETAQLITARARHIANLHGSYTATLAGGFTSSGRTYTTDPASISYLTGAATCSLTPVGSSMEFSIYSAENGVWSFSSHSAAMVQQVLSDWLSFHARQQAKLQGLIANVNSASTISQVQANTW
jgi:hypothetical protein